MIWHFCGKASTNKIELIYERALRFHLNYWKNTYHELVGKCNYTTMLITWIKAIAMEVINWLHGLNPNFMKYTINIKEMTYALKDSNIVHQPRFEHVNMVRIYLNIEVYIYGICF